MTIIGGDMMKNIKTKKIIAAVVVALCMVLVLGLVGCFGNKDKGKDNTDGDSSKPDVVKGVVTSMEIINKHDFEAPLASNIPIIGHPILVEIAYDNEDATIATGDDVQYTLSQDGIITVSSLGIINLIEDEDGGFVEGTVTVTVTAKKPNEQDEFLTDSVEVVVANNNDVKVLNNSTKKIGNNGVKVLDKNPKKLGNNGVKIFKNKPKRIGINA